MVDRSIAFDCMTRQSRYPSARTHETFGRRVIKWWTDGIRDNGGSGRNKECGYVFRIGGRDGDCVEARRQRTTTPPPRRRYSKFDTRSLPFSIPPSPLLTSSPNHSLDHLISYLLQVCVGYFNLLTCTGTLLAIDLTPLPPLGHPNRPPMGTT